MSGDPESMRSVGLDDGVAQGAAAARSVILDAPHLPQSAQPGTQGRNGYSDGSGALFSMYLERAEQEDKRMVESWKGDADGILVFTGLFSAAVATFLSNTYQTLQLDSQDASAFYLARISQRLTSDDGAQASTPVFSDPSSFSPSASTVWVNALWFLSLVISLTCALLATLLQQWTRRYLRATQTPYQPYKRARIRSFYAEGVEKFHVPWTVEALPAMLHLSVFLFFIGLVIFLFPLNSTIFRLVLSWVVLCASLYLVITVLPVISYDSPYHTPLSTFAWFLAMAFYRLFLTIVRFVLGTLYPFAGRHSNRLDAPWSSFFAKYRDYRHRLSHGLTKVAEFAAMNLSSQIDSRALAWTYSALDEDHEMEQFLAGVPGFLNSKTIKDPDAVLESAQGLAHRSSIGFEALSLIKRSFHAGHLTEQMRRRRFETCLRAALLMSPKLFGWGEDDPGIVDLLSLYQELGGANDPVVALAAQCMTARLVFWASPADIQLSIPILERRAPLHLYSHSDTWFLDVKVAHFIHFMRHTVIPCLSTSLDKKQKHITAIEYTLIQLSFSSRGVSPQLLGEFCESWNHIVELQRLRPDDNLVKRVLARLAPLYHELHKGAESSSATFSARMEFRELVDLPNLSYPLCIDNTHHHVGASISGPVHSQAYPIQFPEPLPSMPYAQADAHSPSNKMPLSPLPSSHAQASSNRSLALHVDSPTVSPSL
ncbi:hypothetical protein BC834DRAFT_893418 [Gloeopeniophorella convolvens]|nr:hypothetical protein BC834DRAFT_893418 [Gloeopeniophorella convolvens]